MGSHTDRSLVRLKLSLEAAVSNSAASIFATSTFSCCCFAPFWAALQVPWLALQSFLKVYLKTPREVQGASYPFRDHL